MAEPRRSSEQPHGGHGEGHGHSVAAWAGVGVILLGSVVIAVGVIVASLWVGIAGGVVVIAGAVLAKVLSMMGFGPTLRYDAEFEDGGPGQDKATGGVR